MLMSPLFKVSTRYVVNVIGECGGGGGEDWVFGSLTDMWLYMCRGSALCVIG